MPNEALLAEWEQIIAEFARQGGKSERTAIFTNVAVIDANPAGLTNRIIIQDPRDGDYVPALKAPGVQYANNDLVNVLFVEGTEPLAFQQGSGSSGSNTKVSELWESDFGAAAWQTNATGDLSAVGAYDLTTTGDIDGADITASGNAMADAHGVIVKNTSGATATAGDVGYLDASSEYQTTTTAADEQPRPVLVLVGGANNANIYVTEGPGIGTMNYAGSAPASGDYLEFSATAGSVQSNGTVFHLGIIAQASAAGSGGTVTVKLLLRTVFIPASNSNDIYRTGLTSNSDFVALIDSLPGGAAVRYDTPTSGFEDNLKPNSTSQLAKLVLHNTTRGDSALISDNDPTGGAGYDGEITLTAAVPGTWQVGDTITVRSQTNTAVSGSSYFADFQITSSDIPELTRAIAGGVLKQDSGAGDQTVTFHPFEANATPKTQAVINQVATTFIGMTVIVPLIDRTFVAIWKANGAGTQRWILRIRGYWTAA